MAADHDLDYSRSYIDKCYSKPEVGQIGYNACIAAELHQHEASLNNLYKKLLSALAQEEMLRDSQGAWMKYRDSECALRLSGMDDVGSASQFMRDSC
jgi:uncharacterized protein YecT (DUF1311 family)